MKGNVVIAGAGPGEIDHLTIGVFREIKQADVILYDALIRDSIVAEFPESCEQIFVGKRCGTHAYTQTMIIASLIEHALAGKRVLRLKGGDPSIFAHLASEIDALHALGIPLKILPGVSAMLAAAAELQVPLTTRGQSRHIWVSDGHADDISDNAEQMANYSGTLVFYMGAERCATIATCLAAHGLGASTPCALVENAGSHDAVLQRATLSELTAHRIARLTSGPGILLIGEALRTSNDHNKAYHALAAQF